MKVNWIPALGEAFIADLYCTTCKDYFPHVIMALDIDSVFKQSNMNYECSCSGCSCDLEELGIEGGMMKYKIQKLHKKYEDTMPMAKWKNLVLVLNGL